MKPQAAAAQHFNAASAFSAVDSYDKAVSELLEAKEIFPDLLKEPGFLHILGGNAYHAGQPDLAAEMYGNAVALGVRDSGLLADYADALFTSGQFARAYGVLSGEYGEELTDWLSVINRMACREIIEFTGLDSQAPRELTDEEIASVEENPEVAFDLIVTVNALLFMLWYRLEPDPSKWSLGRACLLGVLNLKAAEIWVAATILAYHEVGRESIVFQRIVETGITNATDEYLEMLGGLLSQDEESKHLKDIVKVAHEVALRTPEDDGFGVYGMTPVIGPP